MGCVYCIARATRGPEWDKGAKRTRLPRARRSRKSPRILSGRDLTLTSHSAMPFGGACEHRLRGRPLIAPMRACFAANTGLRIPYFLIVAEPASDNNR